jgi:hypothetical protein
MRARVAGDHPARCRAARARTMAAGVSWTTVTRSVARRSSPWSAGPASSAATAAMSAVIKASRTLDDLREPRPRSQPSRTVTVPSCAPPTHHINRAAELYRRLGFVETGQTETHRLFEWTRAGKKPCWPPRLALAQRGARSYPTPQTARATSPNRILRQLPPVGKVSLRPPTWSVAASSLRSWHRPSIEECHDRLFTLRRVVCERNGRAQAWLGSAAGNKWC